VQKAEDEFEEEEEEDEEREQPDEPEPETGPPLLTSASEDERKIGYSILVLYQFSLFYS
jgi:radial spoke head protein 4A